MNPSIAVPDVLPWFSHGACTRALFFGLLALAWVPMLASAQRTTTGTGTANYPSATQVGEAMVTSDPETRKIIVVTDDETAQQIGQVITSLDRPAPQVLIKVIFLEITYRDGQDVGVQGSYTWQSGEGTGSIGQQFNGVPGLTSGGAIFSFVGSDFEVMIRAIAEHGKLEVLSRPTILARNNQQAVITVGQQVPLITNVRYDTFGNQINGITYQDVGIILRVTPFITSQDYVEMILSPEISNLSDQTVAISSGTNSVGAPIINRRAADTVVVTPDGQTVVIGGLMQDNKTEVTSKVPWLGDVPLLGSLFRRKITQDTKTELLIFLTPRIVRTPAQLVALSAAEHANAKLLPKAVTEEELNRVLNGLPAKPEEPPPTKKKKRK